MKYFKSLWLLVAVVLLFSGCKKDETKQNNPAPTPVAAFYFSAKLDGKDFLIQDGVDGYGSGAGGGGGGTSDSYTEEQSLSIVNPSAQKNSGFIIVKNFVPKRSDCSQIENMFHPGNYTYGRSHSGSTDPGVDGVIIFHVDENGKEWSSDYGSGDQTGSTFEIVEHVANNDGWSNRISKATFSCKLYDAQGHVKVLTNGEARGRTVQCHHL
jgi:hypothetical protein